MTARKKKQIKKKTTKNKKKLSTEGKGNIGSKIIRIKKKNIKNFYKRYKTIKITKHK